MLSFHRARITNGQWATNVRLLAYFISETIHWISVISFRIGVLHGSYCGVSFWYLPIIIPTFHEAHIQMKKLAPCIIKNIDLIRIS
jgi:membrane glycosyltransferase